MKGRVMRMVVMIMAAIQASRSSRVRFMVGSEVMDERKFDWESGW